MKKWNCISTWNLPARRWSLERASFAWTPRERGERPRRDALGCEIPLGRPVGLGPPPLRHAWFPCLYVELDTATVLGRNLAEFHSHAELVDNVSNLRCGNDYPAGVVHVKSQADGGIWVELLRSLDEHSPEANVAGKSNRHSTRILDLDRKWRAWELAVLFHLLVNEAKDRLAVLARDLCEFKPNPTPRDMVQDLSLGLDEVQPASRAEAEGNLSSRSEGLCHAQEKASAPERQDLHRL